MPDCAGTSRNGKPCRYTARFPEAEPKWCGNCDPSPEAVQRRADAGRTRHRRFAKGPSTSEVDAGLEAAPPKTPTIDYVVDLSLATARGVLSGKIAPDKARAAERLYARALEGLKSRGSHGDAPGDVPAAKPSAVPEPAEKEPTGLDDDGDSLEALGRALDS